MSKLKLGNGKVCHSLRDVERILKTRAQTTHVYYREKITELDTWVTIPFAGGCAFLLSW